MNVRSLLSKGKFDSIKNQILNSHAHIITLSETWLKKDFDNNLLSITGYDFLRLDRSWKDANNNIKKGGGIGIYIKKDLNYNETIFNKNNCSSSNIEIQWVEIRIENMRRILIINTYRPPSGDYKLFNKNIFDSFSNSIIKDNTDIFIMGDMNIDMLDKSSLAKKELEITMNKLCLRNINKEYTRHSNFKNSCIDLIFSNSDYIINNRLLDWNVSDHMGIFVSRKKKKIINNKVKFKGRSYKNYIKEDFQWNIIDENWDKFYKLDDPNDAWNYYKNIIINKIDNTYPVQEFIVNEKRDPWISNELLERIIDKNRLLKKARKSSKKEDWDIAKTSRNIVNKELSNAKKEFLIEEQNRFTNDSKKFWQSISRILPSKKNNSGKITLCDKSDEEMEGKDTADYINEFFTNIGKNLASKIKDEEWRFLENESQNSINTLYTDFEEVLDLCKNIDTSKSSGIEFLSSNVLKDAFMVTITQLVFIFNLSLSKAIFPNDWKKATIIPLFKGGNKKLVSNYRPVSLLPLPGKILEKIVHRGLTYHLENNDLLSIKQGGFRKDFSTVKSILNLTEDLFDNMNNGLVTAAVFIDLRKAFDTVDHKILLKKLRLMGIEGDLFEWCVNYLSNRMQRTLANNTHSKELLLQCGVPQGSVLGPLFFLIYVNDIVNRIGSKNINLYADDTVIYTNGNIGTEIQENLQNLINIFSKWCRENKLSINTDKTKMVCFGTKQRVKRYKGLQINLLRIE